MNKNNIFNFVKYAIFAGILYFIMKKIPAINIREYEILMLIVIIGAGLYSYECLIEGYFQSSKLNNNSSNVEGFSTNKFSSNNDLDNSLELDVDIDDKYLSLDRPYLISNEIVQKAREAADKKRREEEKLKNNKELINESKQEKKLVLVNKNKSIKKIDKLEEIKNKLEEKINKQNKSIRKLKSVVIDEDEDEYEIEDEDTNKKLLVEANDKKLKYNEDLKSVINDLKDQKNKVSKSINEIKEIDKIIDIANEKIVNSQKIIKSESSKISNFKLKIKSKELPNFRVDKNNKKSIIVNDEVVVPLSEDNNFSGVDDYLDSTPLGKLSNKLLNTKKSLDSIKKGIKAGEIPNYNLDEQDLSENEFDEKLDFLENDLNQDKNVASSYIEKNNSKKSKKKSSIINDEVVDLNIDDEESIFIKADKNGNDLRTSKINRNEKIDRKRLKSISNLKQKDNVDYKMNSSNSKEKQRKLKNMPLVQDSDILPEAIIESDNKVFSGVRNTGNKSTKKQTQLKDMESNKKQVSNMIFRDKNVGVFREQAENDSDNEIRRLRNELINPSALNPEDLKKYGLNKFDIQDEIVKNSIIQDYDTVFQESNYKEINDLENKGIVRKKYSDLGPKVLRVDNAFIKGTNDLEKILVDPSTGKEIKLDNLEDDYVKIDKSNGKKYVLLENEDDAKSVKKIYIDSDSRPTEIVEDPRNVKKVREIPEKPKLLSVGDSVGLDSKYDTYKINDIDDTYNDDIFVKPLESSKINKKDTIKSVKKSSLVNKRLESSRINESVDKKLRQIADLNNFELEDSTDDNVSNVDNDNIEDNDSIVDNDNIVDNDSIDDSIEDENNINSKRNNKKLNNKLQMRDNKSLKSKLKKRDLASEQKELIPNLIKESRRKTEKVNKPIQKKKVVKKVYRDMEDVKKEVKDESKLPKSKNVKTKDSNLEISFKIENVNYNKLSSSQKSSIIQDVRARYSVNLGISRNAIDIELLPGPLIVTVRVNLNDSRVDKNRVVKGMVEYNKSVKEEIINTISNIVDSKIVDIDENYDDMVVKEVDLKEVKQPIEDKKTRKNTVEKRVDTRIQERRKNNVEKRLAVDDEDETVDTNDIIDNNIEDSVEEDVIQDVSTIVDENRPIVDVLDGTTPESEIRKLRKNSGPRPVPTLPKIRKTRKPKSNKQAISEIQKTIEEEPTELAGGLRLRSKDEIKQIQKEVRKAETKVALRKLKDNIEGKPVFVPKEERVKAKQHNHDLIHDEISSVKRNLLDEIDDIKDNINKKKSVIISDIEKRNIKVLLKELLSHKVLNLDEVENIYSSSKKGDVNLANVIKALEKLRDSTIKKLTENSINNSGDNDRIVDKKSSMYGDMKYDELPPEKRIPLGDQMPPDDWENQYTLLNTDKWSVPQRKPPLCVASKHMDPLPSNESGYPMLLKEWDNSRVISNTYINQKWAKDQVDTSGF